MANADRPNGFRPFGELLRSNPYTAGSACYPGDVVKQSSDGKVDPVATGGSIHEGACLGVALNYASGDGEEVIVADHPDQLFLAQADSSDVDAQTDLLLNYDIVGNDPDTTYNMSRMEIDGDSGVTTAATPIRVLRLYRLEGDDGLGANAKLVCMINHHELKGGTGTAGV